MRQFTFCILTILISPIYSHGQPNRPSQILDPNGAFQILDKMLDDLQVLIANVDKSLEDVLSEMPSETSNKNPVYLQVQMLQDYIGIYHVNKTDQTMHTLDDQILSLKSDVENGQLIVANLLLFNQVRFDPKVSAALHQVQFSVQALSKPDLLIPAEFGRFVVDLRIYIGIRGFGGYAVIDDKYLAKSTIERTYSPVFEPTSPRQRCLTFWYRYMGERMKGFRVIKQDSTIANRTGGTAVWSNTQWTNREWKYAQVPISSDFYHVIEFEAERYKSSTFQRNNFIHIDDIIFTNGPCVIQPEHAKTNWTPKLPPKSNKKLLPTPNSNSPNNCTFENNTLCTWKQHYSNALNWTLQLGPGRLSMYTGPKFDHTFEPGNKKGYYIYIDVNDKDVGKTAKLQSVDISPKDARCLTFWYHMWGSDVGNSSQVVWSRKKTQGNDWLKADVNLQMMIETFQIVFEAIASNTSKLCSIAIDDLSLSEEKCPEYNNSCDFETSNCEYSSGERDIWNRTGKHYSPNLPISKDHTFNTDYGHYLMLNASQLHIGEDILLKSNNLNLSATNCLKFWYYMNIDISTIFYVTFDNSKDPVIKPSYFRDFYGSWQVAEATLIPTKPPSRLVFHASILSKKDYIAIDDIEITDGPCNRKDGNLCSWTNGVNDDFDWQLQSGKTITTGLSKDHTLGTDEGTYLYIDTSKPQELFHKARLYSPGFQLSRKPWMCLHFWYNMIDTDFGQLAVFQSFQPNFDQLLWRLSRDQGSDDNSQWHYAQVPFPSNKTSSQIMFEATVGAEFGNIAIDDIVITDGYCAIKELNRRIGNIEESLKEVLLQLPSSGKSLVYLQVEMLQEEAHNLKLNQADLSVQTLANEILNLESDIETDQLIISNLLLMKEVRTNPKVSAAFHEVQFSLHGLLNYINSVKGQLPVK
uniref:MAM domain-containing protein n=1 Tax=Strigamia maritima TaxID=126957 RepID=T1IKI3_STRMM